MKTSLLIFGLLFCLTFSVGPARSQQAPDVVPPPVNGGAPYAVPAQFPPGAGTVPVQMQMPPPAYGGDPSQMYQGQQPPQFQQWGAPNQSYAPQGQPQMQNGYPPQESPGPDPGMIQSPPRMSAYEKQEAAIREAQMSADLDEARQQKEMDENFRNGVLAELDDGSKKGGTAGGYNGDQTKLKSGVTKTKNALKTGMRWCAPTASYIGTFFIYRGMTGGF